MAKKKKESSEEEVNLNITGEQKIDKLADGIEILRDELVDSEEREQISDEDLRKLVEFTTDRKNLTAEDLQAIREDDRELERLIRISIAKAKSYTYAPKKHFGTAYKKARRLKNKASKKSRAINYHNNKKSKLNN